MAQPTLSQSLKREREGDRIVFLKALIEASRHISGHDQLKEALEVLENAVYERWNEDSDTRSPFEVGDRVRDKILDRPGTFICSVPFDSPSLGRCQVWFDDNPVKSESWHLKDLAAEEAIA